ncbi:MAG: hypothetical protein AABX98_03770, partial [Nanoarchaeota archaeon]
MARKTLEYVLQECVSVLETFEGDTQLQVTLRSFEEAVLAMRVAYEGTDATCQGDFHVSLSRLEHVLTADYGTVDLVQLTAAYPKSYMPHGGFGIRYISVDVITHDAKNYTIDGFVDLVITVAATDHVLQQYPQLDTDWKTIAKDLNGIRLRHPITKETIPALGNYLFNGPFAQLFAKMPKGMHYWIPEMISSDVPPPSSILHVVDNVRDDLDKIHGKQRSKDYRGVRWRGPFDRDLFVEFYRLNQGARAFAFFIKDAGIGQVLIPADADSVYENVVATVTRNPIQAEKSAAILEAVAGDPLLQAYVTRTYKSGPFFLDDTGIYIWKRANVSDETVTHQRMEQQKVFALLGLTAHKIPETTLQRLYVLAAMHAGLRHLSKNPLLSFQHAPQHVGANELFAPMVIATGASLPDLWLDGYHDAIKFVMRHASSDEISLNEVGAPTWISGSGVEALRDVSSMTIASRGRGIYGDVAQVMLADLEASFSVRYVCSVIDTYHVLRQHFSPKWIQPDTREAYALGFASLYVETIMSSVQETIARRSDDKKKQALHYRAVVPVAREQAMARIKE